MKRLPNFEILRVLLMFFIVVYHMFFYGLNIAHSREIESISFSHDLVGSVTYYLIQISLCFLVVAVNCYVLITGYFLQPQEQKWGRVLNVWLPMLFYSVTLAVVGCLINGNFGVRELVPAFFPIITHQYWFVNCYIAVVLLSPYLTRLTQSLDKRSFEKLLGILILLNFNPYHWNFDVINNHGYGVFWFVVLFLTGAYIRRFDVPVFIRQHAGKLYLLFTVLLGSYICYKFKHLDPYELRVTFLMDYNAHPFLLSILLFVFFMNRKFSDGWLVRTLVGIAPYTFAVYLIHDNSYLRYLIWNLLPDVHDFDCMPVFILSYLLFALILFLVCCLCDYLLRCSYHIIKRITTNAKVCSS